MLATFPQQLIARLGRGTSGLSAAVPKLFPIAIDGNPFLLDESHDAYNNAYSIETIQTLRQQADNSERPGEASINPEGLWPRTQESWHLGAGQSFQDRDQSSPYRFRNSKGIDIHTEWQQSLLHETDFLKENNDNTNLDCFRVGDWVYLVEGNDLTGIDDPFSATPFDTAITPGIHIAETPSSIQSSTNDGFNIWCVVGDGIHKTTAGATGAATHYCTNPAVPFNLVSYQKGHLMAANGRELFDIVAAGLPTAPSPLFTHPNPEFQFVAFASSGSHIYAAGFVGDKSTIYRITLVDTAAELDAPTVACTLPDGEIIYSLDIYEENVFMGIGGEANGSHQGALAGDGSIILGATVPTDYPIKSYEPQGRFMYYGLSNFDSESTGIGRMNLRYDTSGGSQVPTPAYASDLMHDGIGETVAILSFGGKRIFAVLNLGFIRETNNLVASGFIESGSIGYGLTSDKLALFLDSQHIESLVGSYSAEVRVNNGGYDPLGVKAATAANLAAPFVVGQRRGNIFEYRTTLFRDDIDHTLGPLLQRFTLLAYPIADTGVIFSLPILIGTKLDAKRRRYSRNPLEDLQFFLDLRRSTRVVTMQFYTLSLAVTVKDFHFRIKESADSANEVPGPKGILLVQLKTLTS